MKYAFIRTYRREHSVSQLCRVLGVSRSGFYDWLFRPVSQRSKANQKLLRDIQRIHQRSRQNYGAIKTWKALKAEGINCGKHRVARLRREYGIVTKRRRRFVTTTQSRRHAWINPHILERRFESGVPNRVWVGDVTFIATRKGWVYLAVLLDLYSRKVVGWSMSKKNDKALALEALSMAIEQRKPRSGLLHHCDRGSVYTADEYRSMLRENHMIASMSRKGNCWDNAVAESFFNNLKNELVHDRTFETRDEAKAAIFDYIEVFYNRQRLHQTLGYQTPHAFEMKAVA